MYPFKKNILRTSDEDAPEQLLGFCVDWEAHNNGNIKMALTGSINFTQFLAGRTIAFLNGIVDQYRINGVDVACSIPLTHNATTIFFDDDSLPVVTDEVLTQIRIQISMILSDTTEIDTYFEWAALETPTQVDSYFERCYLTTIAYGYRWQFGCADPVHPWTAEEVYVDYVNGAGETIRRVLPCNGDCILINANSIINDEQPGVLPCTP